MPDFRFTFYQAAFHTIQVDGTDAQEAEQVAREYITKFPGSARTTTRDLVRWNVEPLNLIDG